MIDGAIGFSPTVPTETWHFPKRAHDIARGELDSSGYSCINIYRNLVSGCASSLNHQRRREVTWD